MNDVIILPTLKFYKFYNVPLAQEIRDYAEKNNLQWNGNKSIDGKFTHYHCDLDYNVPLVSNMKVWFQECLDLVTKEDLPPSFGCAVTETWMTRMDQGHYLHSHLHPMSVYSGVFYLQDSETGTEFSIPHWIEHRWPQMSAEQKNHKFHSACEQGHLIIFPSHIRHAQPQKHQDSATRYSVAFNSFWHGQLSNKRSTRLTINSSQ